MNPTENPTPAVTGYCRSCGKALSSETMRQAFGTLYCEEHVPAAAPPAPEPPSPYTVPQPAAGAVEAGISPGLAFILGLIPGVGAIYNGQYAKGLIHAIIFGLVISINSSAGVGDLGPLFGMLIPIWVFYMAFEAYHTAKKRQAGVAVDEFSSILQIKGAPGRFPVAPILLIAVGVLFLLNNLGWLRIGELLKFWPVALIALGAYMLYERMSGDAAAPLTPPEVGHEQR
jgi:hypothetical protein